MAKVLSDIWDVHGIDVPIHLYAERRSSKRVSITKTGVNIRIPSYSAKLTLKSDLRWAKNWLESQVVRDPELLDRFKTPDYKTGYIVKTPAKHYILEISLDDRATSAGKLYDNKIVISLNDQLNPAGQVKTIRTIVGRIIGQDQHRQVSDRIYEINTKYFQQSINQIRIKNNSSNWGSCSNNGNINISIKTLLAPLWVQDYIYVHELSHRLEMNHSPKYWAIVKQVMPDYKKAEQWIKKYGNTCEI